MIRLPRFLTALCCLAAVSPALALELGDPAPPLKIAEWVKGKPVTLADGKGKNVYVVEFWATWCPPCVRGIPHLTELQKKYKDKGVVIIGVSIDEETRRTGAKVKPFVENMGDKMDYTVAMDDGGKTSEGYMEAFKVMGIPHAFIVDKAGKIAWHGFPAKMDKVLERVVAGKFDLADAKADEKAEKLMDEYLKTAHSSGDEKKCKEISDELLKVCKDSERLAQLALSIIKSDRIKYRDTDLANKAAKTANDLAAGKEVLPRAAYAVSLAEQGQKAEAAKHMAEAIKMCDTEDEAPLKAFFEAELEKWKPDGDSDKPAKDADDKP